MTTAERIKIIESSCKQVGRGVFFSTLIIVASFLPVFLLEGRRQVVRTAGLDKDIYTRH